MLAVWSWPMDVDVTVHLVESIFASLLSPHKIINPINHTVSVHCHGLLCKVYHIYSSEMI